MMLAVMRVMMMIMIVTMTMMVRVLMMMKLLLSLVEMMVMHVGRSCQGMEMQYVAWEPAFWLKANALP